MSLHKGKVYINLDVSLGEPDIEKARTKNKINYTDLEWDSWREKAKTDDSIYYFSINFKTTLIGEIFLHDINKERGESLIGYHIFSPDNRGKGIGTLALKLLQKYVKEETNLKRLVIITAKNNTPSRKMAESCGFRFTGLSWEDASKVVYKWIVI